MKHPLLSSAVASVALAAAVLSAAQAQPAPSPRKVNRDELRACLDGNDSLLARRKALDARATQIKADQDALKGEGDEIAHDREEQDKNPNTIRGTRLERRISAFNAKLQAARTSAQSFSPEAEALNADLTAHNKRCDGVTFDPADRDAILKERGTPRQ